MTTGNRPRFASWAAVSTLPQAKKISLQDQLAVNREHIQRHGGELVEELVVPGESRNIVLFEDAARRMPAYARLHELIKAKAFDVLIYLDRSRLGRQASLSMAVVALCTTHGIAVYEVENPPASIDAARLQSHDDMLIGAIKSVGAEREVRKLQERHRAGMIGRIKDGQPANKLVYGYRAQFDDVGNKEIVIDEPAAAVVRRIFDLYLAGHGTPHIARSLNDDDIPAPMGGIWQPVNVRSILDNVRRYAGLTAVNRRSRTNRPYVEASAKWAPLIDAETLKRLEAERKFRRDSRRIVDTPYKLSGIVWCMDCQRRLVVQRVEPKKEGNLGPFQMVCPGHGGISYRRVEAKLREKMESLNDADLDSLTSNVDPLDTLRTRIGELAAKLATFDDAIARADNAYVRGTMTLERYEAQLRRINEDSAEVETERAELEAMLVAETERGDQRQRLEETAQLGIAVLDDPDSVKSNAWLRTHVRVWVNVKEHKVYAVHWI